jgi:hypothetical protein
MSDSPNTPAPAPATSTPQTVQVPRFDIVTRDSGRTAPAPVVTEKK